jgi:hypothetical protein
MFVVLLVGILAEMRRTVLSPIIILSPCVVWLAVALWERAKVAGEATPSELFLGEVLLILPLTAVIVVDVIFYVIGFRRTPAKHRDAGFPSHI